MSSGENLTRVAWQQALLDARIGSMATLAVGQAMATYADSTGGSIFPGRVQLAERLGTSAATVKRAQADLIARGFLVAVGSPSVMLGKAQEYRLAIPERGSPVTTSPAERGSPVTTSPAERGSPVTTQEVIPPTSTTGKQAAATTPDLTEDEIAALVAVAPGFDDEPEIARAPEKVLDLDPRNLRWQQAAHDRVSKLEGTSEDRDSPSPSRSRYRGSH